MMMELVHVIMVMVEIIVKMLYAMGMGTWLTENVFVRQIIIVEQIVKHVFVVVMDI